MTSIFALALTVFQILNIIWFSEVLSPWNIGQGRDVQHSQWRYSMANVNLYKDVLEHFPLALTVFQILNISFPEILWPLKYMLSWRRTLFALAPFDGKYLTSYLMAIVMFALSITISEIFATIIKWKRFDLEMKVKE